MANHEHEVVSVLRSKAGKHLPWLCDGEVENKTIHEDVIEYLPQALAYLKETFLSHHTTSAPFKDDREYRSSAKLFHSLFADMHGMVLPSIWTSYEVLLVAWLYEQEHDKLIQKLKRDKLAAQARAVPWVIVLRNYTTLDEEAMQRIHEAVTEDVIIPKLKWQSNLFESFFCEKKLAELAKVESFTKEIYNAHCIRKYCLANPHFSQPEDCFLELYSRFASVHRNLKRLVPTKDMITHAGISDDLKGPLPPGPMSIWRLIDAACCASDDYNVLQLAPLIHRSIPSS